MPLDQTFTIITDHLSLVHAFKKSTASHTFRIISRYLKHFEHMPLDQTFTIITYHLSLVHAFKKSTASPTFRQSRQLSYLAEFDCTFEHIAGHQNSKANRLFRLVVHNIF